MENSKSFEIDKYVVRDAWEKVRANGGSAGIDGVSIADFEENLKDNLYKIWNRMSSGSYFPKPVMAVEIPKKTGGVRVLGIPTVSDRVAQMVAKMYFEPQVEPLFHEDSYGYRPSRSPLDAVGVTRQRCWRYDWVVEFDIKGLFDNIDHALLMRAVDMHASQAWVRLYIKRWNTTPIISMEGEVQERNSGVSQGGVISPVCANLFLHYAFDTWVERTFPQVKFERYADDAVIHCRTRGEAERVLKELDERMKECRLELHPEKTRIAYCADKDRRANYPNTSFDFLGYTFQAIFIKDRTGRTQKNFLPQVSKKSAKDFRGRLKRLNLHKRSGSKIDMLAEDINPMVRGWLNYYAKYCPSGVKRTMDALNDRLVRWAMMKYKRFQGRRKRATMWLREVAAREPSLFAHWERGWLP